MTNTKKKYLNMKFFFITIALIIVSINMVGQNIEPMSAYTKRVQENRSKAKVKEERMYIFPIDKKENAKKNDSLRSEIFFNEFGKPLKSTSYFPDMTIINETEYDLKGNELKMINKDGNGNVKQTIVYEYNHDKSLSKVKYFNASGELTSTKNSKEELENGYKLTRNTKGEVVSKTYSNYDSQKRIYISRLLKPDDEIRYENKYLLDDKMLILEWTITDNIQNRKSKTVFKYDDYGNKTDEFKYDSNGNLTDKIIYVYDDKNLLSKSYWYQPADKLKQISKYIFVF
jgi:hypothetical protein